MSPTGLQRLLDISSRPRFARHVRALGLKPQGLYHGLDPQDVDSRRVKKLPWDLEPNQAGPKAEHPWISRKRRAYFEDSWEMLAAANRDVLVEALSEFSNLRVVLVGWDLDLRPFQPDAAFERPQRRWEEKDFPSHEQQCDSRPGPHAPYPVSAVLWILGHALAHLPPREAELEFGVGVTYELDDELQGDRPWIWEVSHADGVSWCPASVRVQLRHLQGKTKDRGRLLDCLDLDRERGFLFDRTKITSFSGHYSRPPAGQLPGPSNYIPAPFPSLTRLHLKNATFWLCELGEQLKLVQDTLKTLALVDCFVRSHEPGETWPLPGPSYWYEVFVQIRTMTLQRLCRLHLNRLWHRFRYARNNCNFIESDGFTDIEKKSHHLYEVTWQGGEVIAKGLETLCSTLPRDQSETILFDMIDLRRANASALGLADCCSGVHNTTYHPPPSLCTCPACISRREEEAAAKPPPPSPPPNVRPNNLPDPRPVDFERLRQEVDHHVLNPDSVDRRTIWIRDVRKWTSEQYLKRSWLSTVETQPIAPRKPTWHTDVENLLRSFREVEVLEERWLLPEELPPPSTHPHEDNTTASGSRSSHNNSSHVSRQGLANSGSPAQPTRQESAFVATLYEPFVPAAQQQSAFVAAMSEPFRPPVQQPFHPETQQPFRPAVPQPQPGPASPTKTKSRFSSVKKWRERLAKVGRKREPQ